jgi:oxalate decarboxylase/phosphoglucose isomerase-like protein (cupin superfamily)
MGDVIFVPEGWWHATLNLGEVLAVAVREFVAAIERTIPTDFLVHTVHGGRDSLSR